VRSVVSREEPRRGGGAPALRLYALASIFFCCSPAYAIWTDTNFYFQQGSKFQPDATQQALAVNVISNGEKARIAAGGFVDDVLPLGTGVILLPEMSGPNSEYPNYERATVVSTSAYHTWSYGPLHPSGSATEENENNKNTLESYGDTSYACQNLWLDKSGKMNCSQNWSPPIRTDYATMPAESVTGLQTHTFWIKCDGTWVYSYRYYRGCYGPSNWYPTVQVTTAAPGGYASPAEYANTLEYRELLLAAISSITASGFGATTSGVSVTNIQNYYNYLTEGLVIPSSGTTAGSGGTGTTASTNTVNVNIDFPDYAINAPTSGAWDEYNSTSPTAASWRALVDESVEQTSGTLSGWRTFINGFQTNTAGASPCDLTCSFDFYGQTITWDFRNSFPIFGDIIVLIAAVMKLFAGIAALVIIMEGV